MADDVTLSSEHNVKWLKTMADWKDLLPFTLAAFGLLYGIGWALQYQAAARLGVGPLSITRESAMATALALVFTSIPLVSLIVFLRSRHDEPEKQDLRFWFGTVVWAIVIYSFVAFLLCGLPFMLGNASDKQRQTILTYFVCMGVFTFAIFLTPIFGSVKVPRTFSYLMVLALHTAIFVNYLMPTLPEFLGGQSETYVQIRVKEPARIIEAFMGMSDEKAMILRDATMRDPENDAFKDWAPVLRIPVDRIVEMRQMSPPKKSGN